MDQEDASKSKSGKDSSAGKRKRKSDDGDAADVSKCARPLKAEPASPGATKAFRESMKRASTGDLAKHADPEPKTSKGEHIDSDSSSELDDAALERELRKKRDQHARYMRFSRSLKSPTLMNVQNRMLC